MTPHKDIQERVDDDADALLANTLRFLAVDAVQQARSGHPGLPLGAADIVTVLWTYFLKFDPADPGWPNRDRFILSAGHGSALLYALLHVFGYGLDLEDLKAFRQFGSLTPGHPELNVHLGIETTTGPLGQGLGNAVGMAVAERWLAATFNQPGYPLIDHYTYVVVGDGDLMEGVSHEVASLAGHLRLGRLIALYDDNGISIDGPTRLSCSDDTAVRFAAYGWQVLHCDGHDRHAIHAALLEACAERNRPSLILCKTHIGYGSPRQDSAKAHGEPLGEENLRETKAALGWPLEPALFVPDAVRTRLAVESDIRTSRRRSWQRLLADYRTDHSDLAVKWDRWQAAELPPGWQDSLLANDPGKPEATRTASGRSLEQLADVIPWLIGGSADLTPSNNTRPTSFGVFNAQDYSGRYLHFGVREHGMGTILNGLALQGLRPYGGTFLVFSDYMRPAIRMAALMGLPVIYVFTHDSIGVGEDGPTHQPIEHLMALRAIPNLWVIRPADGFETMTAWQVAVERKNGPTALILTRQALPPVCGNDNGLTRGAYVLLEPDGQEHIDLILVATGSEVHLAVEVSRLLQKDGVASRVVSMPCWELYEAQTSIYKKQVFPPGIPVMAVEAGCTQGWADYTSRKNAVWGLDRFGSSGAAKVLFERFGFTASAVAKRAKEELALSRYLR